VRVTVRAARNYTIRACAGHARQGHEVVFAGFVEIDNASAVQPFFNTFHDGLRILLKLSRSLGRFLPDFVGALFLSRAGVGYKE